MADSSKEIARNKVPVFWLLISFIVLLPEGWLAWEPPAMSRSWLLSKGLFQHCETLVAVEGPKAPQTGEWPAAPVAEAQPWTLFHNHQCQVCGEFLHLKLWQAPEMNLCGWILIYTACLWTPKWSLEQSRLRSREAPWIWHHRNYFASLF